MRASLAMQGPFSMSENSRRFVSGAVSGTVTAALLQPLDVIKTTQQGHVLGRGLVVSGVPSAGRAGGVFETGISLVRQEGVWSLWKGLNATVVRVFFGAGLYFVSLHALNDALGSSKSGSGFKSFIAGAVARSFSAAVLSPVAVVKTRLEWAAKGTTPYKGTLHALRSIAATEGLASLYSGLLPTILRDAPFSGLYFAFFTSLRSAWTEARGTGGSSRVGDITAGPDGKKHYPPVMNFTCGFLAGVGATLLTHPADVIKTRLQIRDAKGRFVDGAVLLTEVRALLAQQGAKGFFVGLEARVGKRAGQTALTWTLFEELLSRSGMMAGSSHTGGGGGGGA